MIDPDDLAAEKASERPVTETERETMRLHSEASRRWLEEHTDFRPLGYEW